MTPTVGQVIRLEDARGCWRLHIVARADKRFDDAIELAGQCWSGLRFHRVPPTRALPFSQAFIADRPAIGPADVPFSPLHVPAGWLAPVVVTEVGVGRRIGVASGARAAEGRG